MRILELPLTVPQKVLQSTTGHATILVPPHSGAGSDIFLACVNKTSIWETCKDTDGTPCDDTTLTWLHTLNRGWFEVVANLLLGHLAITIPDPDRSRIVSIDFIDNPYKGDHYLEEGELCSMAREATIF